MENENGQNKNEIYSRVIRAKSRTYFFDVRETRAGEYYLTITESKRNQNHDGEFSYRKHKLFLYQEAFEEFKESLEDVMQYIATENPQEEQPDNEEE